MDKVGVKNAAIHLKTQLDHFVLSIEVINGRAQYLARGAQILMDQINALEPPKKTSKVNKLWRMTGIEMSLVKDGRMISAIKMIRERKDLSLVVAKNMVDRYRDHLLEGKS